MSSVLFWAAIILTSYAVYPRASARWTPAGEVTSIPAELATLGAVTGQMVLLIQVLSL